MSQGVQGKLTRIVDSLENTFVERDEVVRGIAAALIARQHCFFLGPPGTAKSALCKQTAEAVQGADYFETLLTKFTTPEEVFGPVSLKGLENDRYERITAGKLPTAHLAFIDEVWKASSAILNSLLTIANERLFQNGNGRFQSVPLMTMLAASNELPESEELNALYDRFMLRYVVDYIAEDGNFKKMLQASATTAVQAITLPELEQAQREAAALPVPDSVYDAMLTIRKRLKEEGIIPSDRRFRQSLETVKANSYLNGNTSSPVSEDDLSMLQHVLWNEPAQIPVVKKIVLEITSPYEGKALELYDQASEIYQNTMSEQDANKKCNLAVEANAKLKKILASLTDIITDIKTRGRDTSRIEKYKEKVDAMNKKILKDCLGLGA